jgi:hypothetical protein
MLASTKEGLPIVLLVCAKIGLKKLKLTPMLKLTLLGFATVLVPAPRLLLKFGGWIPLWIASQTLASQLAGPCATGHPQQHNQSTQEEATHVAVVSNVVTHLACDCVIVHFCSAGDLTKHLGEGRTAQHQEGTPLTGQCNRTTFGIEKLGFWCR